MPPWAATPVLPLLLLLLLLLLVQGRGGQAAIGISSLEMDIDRDMGVEAQMGSEAAAHGRLLWATGGGGGRRYISYDALRGDAVPCSRPGVPYYNCRVSTTANPYTRGCESITRCRDDDPS